MGASAGNDLVAGHAGGNAQRPGDGLQKPVGLRVADMQLNVPVQGQTRKINLDAGDLARLLQTLAGKEK
jgi:hypothetical protein